MKIYTKAGDKGTTSLLGGNLVPKDHPRLEAFGTLDELNSQIGLLRDHLTDPDSRETLLGIQKLLMAGSAILANERQENEKKIPNINEEDVIFLEGKIDDMDKELEPLQNFILPGGHPHVSLCHLARTTCRKAERQTIRFIKDSGQTGMLVKYLNRLSDYLFTLARKTGKNLNVREIPWQADL